MITMGNVLPVIPLTAFLDLNEIPGCWIILGYNSNFKEKYEGKIFRKFRTKNV